MSEVYNSQNQRADDVLDGSTGLVALISPEQLGILQQLWGISRRGLDSSAGLDAVLVLFAQLLDADNCSWLAACHGKSPSDIYFKEIFNGWWATDIVNNREGCDTKEKERAYYQYVRENGVDPITQQAVNTVGKSRVISRKEMFTDAEWLEHPYLNEFLLPQYNTAERMVVIFSVDTENESYFIVDRVVGKDAFSDQDMQLAYLATTGISSFHHRLFFERGFLPPASKALSPRERQVFALLLQDVSEKEIAQQLGVSVHTAHQYITSVFRIFKVRGRTGLLAALMNVIQ